MSSKTARKILNVFGIISYIAAVLFCILAVVFAVKGDSSYVKEAVENIKIDSVEASDMVIVVTVTLGVMAIISFLEGWLMRRVAKDGNKSTFLLVLLVLSTISGVTSLFTAGTAGLASGIVSLCITLLTLYSVIVLRKEAKN